MQYGGGSNNHIILGSILGDIILGSILGHITLGSILGHITLGSILGHITLGSILGHILMGSPLFMDTPNISQHRGLIDHPIFQACIIVITTIIQGCSC